MSECVCVLVLRNNISACFFFFNSNLTQKKLHNPVSVLKTKIFEEKKNTEDNKSHISKL